MLRKLALFAMVAMFFFAVQAGRANADLITNGNFGTGDFTGWTVGGDTVNAFYSVYGHDSVLPNGNYAQFFTYGAPVTISQTLATSPGTVYTVSFSLYNSDHSGSPGDISSYNEFQALWNGSVIPSVHLVNAPAFNWTEYEFTATAASPSAVLTFSFQQDGSNFNFTNASAVPVPGALLLFGPGLLGLMGVRRRITK